MNVRSTLMCMTRLKVHTTRMSTQKSSTGNDHNRMYCHDEQIQKSTLCNASRQHDTRYQRIVVYGGKKTLKSTMKQNDVGSGWVKAIARKRKF